jgi:hypothetical protein
LRMTVIPIDELNPSQIFVAILLLCGDNRMTALRG